jgi:hypothetical protein
MKTKALIVGIDEYQNPAWNLQGCTMDAAIMSGILQDHYDFLGDTIRLVLNDRATKANIEKRLDWLVRDAQAGDVLVFYYAGHGSQVRDRNGDELEDYMDEILCPHDLNWDDPLTDDILHSYFQRVPIGANLTLVFDCCNSGTGTRSLYVPVSPEGEIQGEPEYKKTRYIKPPIDIGYRSRGIQLKIRRLGESVIKEDHVLLAACTSSQEAQEKHFDGQTRGAFSYYLGRCLKSGDWKITYRQAHEGTRIRLKDHGFIQIPQLEAPLELMDKTIFSSLVQ